jgi:protein TonB
MQRAQVTARADNITRLAQLFNERIQQNRLLEPANDSARYYYNALRQADASHPATQAARASLVHQILDEARVSMARSDFTGADHWLGEATAAGASTGDLAGVEHDLQAARERVAHASDVVSASALKRVKYVQPRYPEAARAKGIGGWVDVEFRVRADGSVADVRALEAEPRGVFDKAAVEALSGWRFEPVVRDGVTVEQRAMLRVRFALEK